MSQQNSSEQMEFFPASSPEDFPAKISQLQDSKKALREKGRACGQSAPVYLGSFDPITQSLKTSQRSLVEIRGDGFSEFSGTFPRSGMMRSGTVYQLDPLVPNINATESGSFPSPTAHDRHNVKNLRKDSNIHAGGFHSVSLVHFVEMYPTAQASDYRDRGNLSSPCVKRRKEKGKQISLSQSVSKESGSLNPEWVEWLMGYPIGHTDLKD